ncbi:choice-of-anchor L domain-containing protein [Mesonia sp.]|uniref:T9SS type B sorting domain-containing protein n=1 Tax=Mesonia sp. TaxID=1960830 RepID=UPI0025B87E59|nr:choice-of-anchor L domain-containing protein [Mesonia sp.]
MKKLLLVIFLLIGVKSIGQSITVDANTYSPQELVENILINSGCIDDVTVTGSVSGSFNSEKSYGYFDRDGTTFPFDNGLVLSTGRLSNVPGPNNNLSDDDAAGWGPDQDLEQVLGITNTLNATVIEFNFTPNANTIQFRYIFASEEYQIGDANTCEYSDVFGFLIKPLGGTYQNIAVVPGTNTPVKVTTVHPEIVDGNEGCDAQNEQYFESFNNSSHPINFNGQTKPLVAQANVVAGTTYKIKLVIADDYNYRYDSAVFLEGNSFNIGADLGEDLTGANALCENETYTLSVSDNGNSPTNYDWYQVNNSTETVLTSGASETEYEVSSAGTYKVVLTYGPNCTAEDTIEIEYVDFTQLSDQIIYECDTNNDGLSIFNLNSATQSLTNNDPTLSVTNFFLTDAEAQANTNPIQDPDSFNNTVASQTVFARIIADAGCTTTLGLTLETSFTNYDEVYLVNCYNLLDNDISFNLTDAEPAIEEEIGISDFSVTYFETENDALSNQNPLLNTIQVETSELPKTIFGKISNASGCQGIIEVVLRGIQEPEIEPNYQAPFLCLENLDGVTIESGVIDNPTNYTFLWENGETTPTIQADSLGTYQVDITKTEVINGETYECTTTNSITVNGSEKAQFSYEIEGSFDNYSVIISAEGIGDYVYSLDDQFDNYQSSPIFYNVGAGEHRIYVKDLNGCGISFEKIIVLGYPKFFTPNQDGINDTWGLIGTERFNRRVENVYIFDRFGKLLTSISHVGQWDGTYHGKQMPSNEYWFLVTFKDAPDFKGHFTLKR